jgi:hypothetical protein
LIQDDREAHDSNVDDLRRQNPALPRHAPPSANLTMPESYLWSSGASFKVGFTSNQD